MKLSGFGSHHERNNSLKSNLTLNLEKLAESMNQQIAESFQANFLPGAVLRQEPVSALSRLSHLSSPSKEDLVDLGLKELQTMVSGMNSAENTDRTESDKTNTERELVELRLIQQIQKNNVLMTNADQKAIDENQFEKLLSWLRHFKDGHLDF